MGQIGQASPKEELIEARGVAIPVNAGAAIRVIGAHASRLLIRFTSACLGGS
jgi:hypothetical protein